MSETKGPDAPQAEVIPEGHWLPDGTWQAPEGWPEGAGWVVKNADGTIDRWGPPSDFQLVATTDMGDGGPLPPAEELGIALKGVPTPAEEEQ